MGVIDTILILRQMRSNQRLEQEKLESLQLDKLNRLLRHASETVPHYCSLSGVRLRDITDFSSIPVLSKSSVRDSPDSFISSAFPRSTLSENFTSGSSGTQVPIYTSRRETSYGVAFECHHLLENGIGVFDAQARVTHFHSEPNLLQRIGVMRCYYLPVQKSEGDLLRALEESGAGVLCAYPSILRSLALANEGLKLKMIFTGGELLHEQVRKMAEKSFSCPVRDRYGSMESSWVAWQCEKGSYHVQSDQALVEVVDESGEPLPEGKTGRIVVTPLWRTAMPFIRYDLGDRGALGGKCACGRSLPVMKGIEGRDDDFIRLPSGRLRSARTVNLLDDIRGILSYQITQEKPDLFVVRFTPSRAGLLEAERSEIRKRIVEGCLGESVSVEFEQAEHLRGTSGKIRTVVSKVR
jgi:phenylacetate-CoA ligase